jgi:tetratricopeptide (TPR) repeat protein
LEASARRYQARAGHASAATAFVRAAELSADEGRRTGRLAAAAEASWAAGQPERARELIARALPLATGEVRVRLLHLRGVIEARTGDIRSGVAVLLEAADASEDASRTLELLSEATEAAAYAGDYSQAAAIGARAGAIEPGSETDRFRVAALSGMAAERAGDHERAAPLLREAIRHAEQLEDPHALIWAALMATTGGTLGEGLRWATRAVAIARERALLNVLPVALWQRSAGLVGQGRFKLAYASGEEGLRLASDFRAHLGRQLEPREPRQRRCRSRGRVTDALPRRRGDRSRHGKRRAVDRRLCRVGAWSARAHVGQAARGDRPAAARDRRRATRVESADHAAADPRPARSRGTLRAAGRGRPTGSTATTTGCSARRPPRASPGSPAAARLPDRETSGSSSRRRWPPTRGTRRSSRPVRSCSTASGCGARGSGARHAGTCAGRPTSSTRSARRPGRSAQRRGCAPPGRRRGGATPRRSTNSFRRSCRSPASSPPA